MTTTVEEATVTAAWGGYHGRTGELVSRYTTWTLPCGCTGTTETAVVDLGQGDTWIDACWTHTDPEDRWPLGPDDERPKAPERDSWGDPWAAPASWDDVPF